jgi:hypothetical protein
MGSIIVYSVLNPQELDKIGTATFLPNEVATTLIR